MNPGSAVPATGRRGWSPRQGRRTRGCGPCTWPLGAEQTCEAAGVSRFLAALGAASFPVGVSPSVAWASGIPTGVCSSGMSTGLTPTGRGSWQPLFGRSVWASLGAAHVRWMGTQMRGAGAPVGGRCLQSVPLCPAAGAGAGGLSIEGREDSVPWSHLVSWVLARVSLK